MCHTFLASLQQIFQNPLDDFHTQWYFSCKSHCSCGLVWTFPQDVVVFILNTASPWIIPERSTAPQHTRFILPSVSPDKILRLYCVGGIFLFRGRLHLENFMSRPNVIPALQSTPLQNRGRNFVRGKRRFTYMSSGTLYLFLRLNNSETTFGNTFWAQQWRARTVPWPQIFNSWKFPVHPGLHFSNSCEFSKWSCWGVPAPNPAE